MVRHCAAEVTSSELSAGQAQQRFAIVRAHAHFCLDNFEKHTIKGFLESIRLFLKQFVTFLGTNSLGFENGKVPKNRSDMQLRTL